MCESLSFIHIDITVEGVHLNPSCTPGSVNKTHQFKSAVTEECDSLHLFFAIPPSVRVNSLGHTQTRKVSDGSPLFVQISLCFFEFTVTHPGGPVRLLSLSALIERLLTQKG